MNEETTGSFKSGRMMAILIIGGVILIGAMLLFTVAFQNQSKQPKGTTPQISPQSQQQTPPSQLPVSAEVTITKDSFVPQAIQVKKNTQITFTNTDSKPHWIASDPHPMHNSLTGFDSKKALGKNDSFSFLFEKSGTFTYHDHLNPFILQGTVIVK